MTASCKRVPFRTYAQYGLADMSPDKSNSADMYFRHVQLYASMSQDKGLFSERSFERVSNAKMEWSDRFQADIASSKRKKATGEEHGAGTSLLWEVTKLCDSQSLPMKAEEQIVGILGGDGEQFVVVRHGRTHITRIIRHSFDSNAWEVVYETEFFCRFERNPLTGDVWCTQGDILNWVAGEKEKAVANPGNMFARLDLESGKVDVLRGNEKKDFLPFQLVCSSDGTQMAYSNFMDNTLHTTDSSGNLAKTHFLANHFPVFFDVMGDAMLFVGWGGYNVFFNSSDIYDGIYSLKNNEISVLGPTYYTSSMQSGMMGIAFHKGRVLGCSYESLFEIDEAGNMLHVSKLSEMGFFKNRAGLPYSLVKYNNDLAIVLWNGNKSAAYHLRLVG